MSRPMSSGIRWQELVEVDDGRDLAAQIEQRQQDVALAQARTGDARATTEEASC